MATDEFEVWFASMTFRLLLEVGSERKARWLFSDSLSRSILRSSAVVGRAVMREGALMMALEVKYVSHDHSAEAAPQGAHPSPSSWFEEVMVTQGLDAIYSSSMMAEKISQQYLEGKDRKL